LLSFFRINDPYRLLILSLAILLVRLPYFIDAAALVYEHDWMMIGSYLSQSNVTLYKDLLVPIAPLSALVYLIFDFVFAGNKIVCQVASLLLVIYQFSLFNNIMYKNKAYNENGYIPALIYALLMQVFFDFFTLSPVLISLTFILLVLDNIYLRIENKLDDFTILKTGFFMGLAVLFYLPSIVFLLATIVSFALLTSLIFRRYILMLYGFLLPVLLVALYYFWDNALFFMLDYWVIFTFTYLNDNLINLWSILTIIALPGFIYLIALYKTFATSRFTNYQVRVQQVMFIMFLAALGTWFLSNKKAPYQLIIFVPFVAFFVTHYILLFKRKFYAEILIATFSIMLIGLNYFILFNGSLLTSYNNFYELQSTDQLLEESLEGSTILILGSSKSFYYGSILNTPYFNWELSKKIWLDPADPEKISAIYSVLSERPPEVIIDQEKALPAVFDRMPDISIKFEQVSANIYQLKP